VLIFNKEGKGKQVLLKKRRKREAGVLLKNSISGAKKERFHLTNEKGMVCLYSLIILLRLLIQSYIPLIHGTLP